MRIVSGLLLPIGAMMFVGCKDESTTPSKPHTAIRRTKTSGRTDDESISGSGKSEASIDKPVSTAKGKRGMNSSSVSKNSEPKATSVQTPPSKTTSVNPVVPGAMYARVFAQKQKEGSGGPLFYTKRCDRTQFSVDGHDYDVSGNAIYGSDTSIYFTPDRKYVIKYGNSALNFSKEMLWREAAGLEQMEATGISPKMVKTADLSRMDEECRKRAVFMTVVPGRTLFDLRYDPGFPGRILEVGRAALHAMEKMHNAGVLHGDIHGGNIMIGDMNAIETSLRIIDFGRSLAYVDPVTGAHKAAQDLRPVGPAYYWAEHHLSPNELEGGSISRRDDVFRLAETLIKMIDGFQALPAGPMAQAKRNRVTLAKVDNRLAALYRYSLQMGFEEKPNYRFLD